MKPKKPIGGSYEQWISYYNATVPHDTWSIEQGEKFLFDPDHGIITYNLDPRFDAIVISRAAGDGQWIDDTMTALCRQYGMKRGILLTYRNPEPFIRKYGMKVHAVFLEREV